MTRILVVEDEPEIREIISRALSSAEHEVVAVGSGSEALAAVEATSFGAVLLDLGLPDADKSLKGFRLCYRLRYELGYDVPVFIVTGWGAEAEEEAREGGMIAIRKPFDQKQLRDLVYPVLRRGRTARRVRTTSNQLAAPSNSIVTTTALSPGRTGSVTTLESRTPLPTVWRAVVVFTGLGLYGLALALQYGLSADPIIAEGAKAFVVSILTGTPSLSDAIAAITARSASRGGK